MKKLLSGMLLLFSSVAQAAVIDTYYDRSLWNNAVGAGRQRPVAG